MNVSLDLRVLPCKVSVPFSIYFISRGKTLPSNLLFNILGTYIASQLITNNYCGD